MTIGTAFDGNAGTRTRCYRQLTTIGATSHASGQDGSILKEFVRVLAYLRYVPAASKSSWPRPIAGHNCRAGSCRTVLMNAQKYNADNVLHVRIVTS